jgi:two-component system response regulator BaeR
MLPHKDGISCCKEIREFSDVPIIMLTAKAEEIERIIGLKAGADDYVCKPFSAVELLLRVQGMLRRVNKTGNEHSFFLDTDSFIIKFNKKEVQLTHLEFLSFNLLYQKPGRVYSREQIIELAYPHLTETNERAIDCHIKNIRKKIKTLSITNNVIESVYGAGYRYTAPDNESTD